MFSKLFRQPNTASAGRRQKFVLLWLGLFMIIMFVLSLGTLNGAVFESVQRPLFIFDVLILVITGGLFFLAARGKTRLAASLFTGLVLILFTAASLLVFHRPINFTTFGYFMVLSLAGTVLRRRGALYATIGCCVSLLISLLGYELKWFPGEEVNSVGSFFWLCLVLGLGFFMLYTTSYIFVQDLQEASQKLADSNQELEQKRQALLESQQVLEHKVVERTAELHQANQALQLSRVRLQTILDYNPAAILVFDSDSLAIIEANRTATQLFGYTLAEFQDHSFLGLCNGGSLDEAEVRQQVALTSYENAVELSTDFRKVDTNFFATDTRLVRLPDEDGQTLILASILDISDKRRAEAQFQRLFEQASDAVFYVSQNGDILNANEQAGRLLGYTNTTELLALPFGDVWKEFVPNRTLKTHNQVSWRAAERMYTHKDGVLIPVEVSVGKVNTTELVYIARDIRERKKRELEIQQEKSNLEQIISAIPGSVMLIGINDRCLLWMNSEAEKLVGNVDTDTAQAMHRLFATPETYYELSEILHKNNLSTTNFVCELVDRQNTVFWANLSVQPCVYQERQALIVIIQNVDKLQKAQQVLQRSQKLESLGMLAGGIAHDFNNLLQVMMGQLELMGRKLPSNNPVQTNLAKISVAIEKATSLSRQMLAYSGRGHFEIQPIDLNKLVLENTALFEASISKSIRLNTSLAENLAWIEADVSQMQQVVMNLIINAAQAIGDQPGKITIRTENTVLVQQDNRYWHYTGLELNAGKYVRLSVEDNGPGIPADVLEKIFSPFFSTKASSGMGLAVVLGIIRGHKGGLWVDTVLGQGTTFDIVFPCFGQGKLAGQKQAGLMPMLRQNLRGMVLVIDDDDVVRETISELLQVFGMHVLLADSSQIGVELFRQNLMQVQFVILDLSVSAQDSNGADTFHQLRQLNPRIKILLSSGYNNAEFARRLVYEGKADFIQKPYTGQQLTEKTIRLLTRTETGNLNP
jgi:PAS domain S-box-containing protein